MATDLSIFTGEQASRLTGVSQRQLAYWDKTGFFSPQFRDEDGGAFKRAYSLRDVIELRTLGLLRSKKVSLPQLREAKQRLDDFPFPWSQLTFWVGGRRVYWDDPESGTREGVRPPGQTVMKIEMDKIEGAVQTAIRDMVRRRADEDRGRITRHRYVKHNEWVISGTRIPVSAILDFHRAGYDTEAIIREYPRLTPEDVAAALEWEKRAS
jgi:uncharacterized protein (DUF433 family)